MDMSAHKLFKNCWGQDIIEYALVAGFLAVSVGAVVPSAATGILNVFSKVASVTGSANSASDGPGAQYL
jgi:pilus assembly protein Flp/PilA